MPLIFNTSPKVLHYISFQILTTNLTPSFLTHLNMFHFDNTSSVTGLQILRYIPQSIRNARLVMH